MKVYVGVDLGSTTTKAVLLDQSGEIVGRGITNSRSNYDLAARIARDEAYVNARFTVLERALEAAGDGGPDATRLVQRLLTFFRRNQDRTLLERLREAVLREARAERVAGIADGLRDKLGEVLDAMENELLRPSMASMLRNERRTSDFFRDRAASSFNRFAERVADDGVRFEDLTGIFDKAILQVENTPIDLTFDGNIRAAVEACSAELPERQRPHLKAAADAAVSLELDEMRVIGTGYGRQRLPFPKDAIRSEILCHGLGAHRQFPGTRTVLDIGGQDTKAIQVDADGIVTGFQMNDRCAAGCGRYLGYIADEMSLGVHELGPLAMQATRQVKITSTCTVFAGAELRDRLTLGQRREDILAGLHRAIILRAMALLARSGGVEEQMTFTGGVANNVAAVKALRQLVSESYGDRTLNISPGSIYTGALGAALFAQRDVQQAAA